MNRMISQTRERWIRDQAELKPVLPFFLILTVAILALCVITLKNQPEMRAMPQVMVFGLLMFILLVLHWCLLLLPLENKMVVSIYLAVQLGLATGIIQMTQSETLVIGLFMPIFGQTFGFVVKRWQLVINITVISLVATANIASLFGLQHLLIFIASFIPLAFFVTIYVLLFRRQLEGRQRAQELLKDLEIAHSQLAEAATRIEDLTLVNERQRMARELHDTLAQGLAGVILQLEAADSHLSSKNPDRAQTILQQAMERARQTLQDSRRVIDDLRSGVNASLGLEEVIRREVQRFSHASGVFCQVEVSLVEPVSEIQSETIQRMVVEGLSNTARYANASHAWVKLFKRDDQIELEVGDDGVGFEPDQTIGRAGHYGLLGMTERARLAGGSLEINSLPGKGSLLRLVIPL
jgi:NarL family two-component system sensor histidine kinase YdfH